jgi:Domain of unknown function (DUF4329)
MGAIDQHRFLEAVRAGRGDGNWSATARALGGLAMFDILPALAQVDEETREQILRAGRGALALGAFQRIEFAKTVISTQMMVSPPSALHEDQVNDVRRYLLAALKPATSQASLSGFSSMDAAAIRAIDEIDTLTKAIQREFSGSIYIRGGAYEFTPPEMAVMDWSSSQVAVPKGTQWVATYHAHPAANPDAENFSPQDVVVCRGIKNGTCVLRPPLINYLGTPSGRIKKLTPRELLQGADVDAYGPDGKQEVLR